MGHISGGNARYAMATDNKEASKSAKHRDDTAVGSDTAMGAGTRTGAVDGGGLVRAIENGNAIDRVRGIESDGKIETRTGIGNAIGRALATVTETEMKKIESPETRPLMCYNFLM